MAKTLFGTVKVKVLENRAVHATIGMNHPEFELAGTSKKTKYRLWVFRGGVQRNSDPIVIKTDAEDSIIGHVDDYVFPSNNTFVVQGQARTHHPDNVLYPKKYRPLDEIAQFHIPKTESGHISPEWLIPVLHLNM